MVIRIEGMSKVHEVIGVTTTLSLLATIFVILRAVSRFGILRSNHVDDYLMIAAVMLSWSLTGIILVQIPHKLGQHKSNLTTISDIRHIYFYCYIYLPIYDTSLMVIRLSALFQFLRFFFNPRTRITVKVLIAIISIYGTSTIFTSIFACDPIQSFWDAPPIETPRCINLLLFWYFNGAFEIVADIAIVILPLYEIKVLDLPKRQLWVVRSIFALGGATCIFSALRMRTIDLAIRGTDATYDVAGVLLWSSIEVNIAIVCSCIQPLKPLIQKFKPSWLERSISSSSATSTSGQNTLRMGHIKKLGKMRINTFTDTKSIGRAPTLIGRHEILAGV